MQNTMMAEGVAAEEKIKIKVKKNGKDKGRNLHKNRVKVLEIAYFFGS